MPVLVGWASGHGFLVMCWLLVELGYVSHTEGQNPLRARIRPSELVEFLHPQQLSCCMVSQHDATNIL